MSAPAYALPSQALTDDSEKNPLHPDLTRDSLKLCMYVAMGGASGETGGRDQVIARTKILRDYFKIPFDDDVWALVMAYVSLQLPLLPHLRGEAGGRTRHRSGRQRRRSLLHQHHGQIVDGLRPCHLRGEREWQVEGFRDNECTKTDSIHTKFSDNNFMVYKGAKSAISNFDIGVKLAHMPQSMVATLSVARSLYKDVKIDNQPYQAMDVHKKADKWQGSLQEALYQKKDLSYNELEIIMKAIEGWDASMPKNQ